MDDTFTPVTDVGEFGLIERIKEVLAPGAERVEVGIGDDAAAFATTEGSLQLITTDSLIEHVHFDRTYTPMRHLGYKAISVNVSDIAAMNGVSRVATVAIGLPNSISVEMVEALYAGMRDAAEGYGLSVVGGDTTASHKLVLTVTVVGECARKNLVRRSGATPGDLLCITGNLGASYAGLRILQHHKERLLEEGDGYEPDLSAYAPVIERHLRPTARTDIVASLQTHGLQPRAMIDLSDGLASDLRHLCASSNCGADINLDSILISPETKAVASLLDEPIERYALTGGEDYELLFAVDPSRETDLKKLADVQVVGVCLPTTKGIRVTRSGVSVDLGESGFAHF